MRVLFCLTDMNIGGMERSLLNLFECLPSNYDITLLLLEKKGGFLGHVPKNINIISLENYSKIKDYIHNAPLDNIKTELNLSNYAKALKLLILYLITKITGNWLWMYNIFSKDLKSLEGNWDIAIAYAGPHNFISYYIAQKVNAVKRIAWVHFDLSKIKLNVKTASIIYRKFDCITVVSEDCKKEFLKLFPQFKKKVSVLHNQISPETIRKLSKSGPGFFDKYDGIRIVTVGRLSKEKGHDLFIPVVKRLVEENYNIRWYCIGDGNMRQILEQMIIDANLEQYVMLKGAYENPYPFMLEADIYLQPSRYEGHCVTILEAKCLHKPIVCTNFAGASEEIENEQNGLIVETSEEGLYRGLVSLLNNPQLAAKFSSRLSLTSKKQIVIDLS